MTQLRNDPDSIRNYFDTLLTGIGHRGSSFTDIDALTHDRRTHRFLVQEFKRPNESFGPGQRDALLDLSLEPRFTVWYVQRWNSDQIAWADMRALTVCGISVITEEEYRDRFRAWWNNRYDFSRYVEVSEEIVIRSGPRVEEIA